MKQNTVTPQEKTLVLLQFQSAAAEDTKYHSHQLNCIALKTCSMIHRFPRTEFSHCIWYKRLVEVPFLFSLLFFVESPVQPRS